MQGDLDPTRMIGNNFECGCRTSMTPVEIKPGIEAESINMTFCDKHRADPLVAHLLGMLGIAAEALYDGD